jgi:type II secretory pathway pseudopilin PulG
VFLNTAMEANPMGVVLVAAVALVATITALGVALYKVATAESEEEKAAKKTAAAYEDAQEAATAAKEAYNTLTDNLDAYDDLIEKLNECTKGTQDWADAFDNVREKILEIIKEYPELLTYSNLYNDDGTLNEDILSEIEAKYEMVKNATSYAEQMIYSKNLQSEADVTSSNLSSDLYNNLVNFGGIKNLSIDSEDYY